MRVRAGEMVTKPEEAPRVVFEAAPGARLVLNGYKGAENRSWKTRHRGPLLIHASRSRPDCTADEIERTDGVTLPREFEAGGIVGVVDVVDCVKRHPSKSKFRGSWAGRLAIRDAFHFACKGFAGVFKSEL
jgi:hypothetical protein